MEPVIFTMISSQSGDLFRHDNARPHLSNCLDDALTGKNLSTGSTHCAFACSITRSIIHWTNLRHIKVAILNVAYCKRATQIVFAHWQNLPQENNRFNYESMSRSGVASIEVGE